VRLTYIAARLPTAREPISSTAAVDPHRRTQKIDIDETGQPIGYSENVWACRRVQLVVPGYDWESM